MVDAHQVMPQSNLTIPWSTEVDYAISVDLTSIPVSAVGLLFQPGQTEYGPSGQSEQYTKLSWLFNLFEQYQLSKIIVRFVPRYSQMTNLLWYQQGGSAPPSPSLLSVIAGNEEIWMLPDKEDNVVRGSIQEFQQARMDRSAVGGSILTSHTLHIDPFWSTVGNNPLSVTDQPQNTIPERTQFMGTKSTDGVGNYALALYDQSAAGMNHAMKYAGMKYYFYNPFVNETSLRPNLGTAIGIGMFRVNTLYHFRYPDIRAIIGTPQLIMKESDLLNKTIKNYHDEQKQQVPIMTGSAHYSIKGEAQEKRVNPEAPTPLLDALRKKQQAMEDITESSQTLQSKRSRQA